jgi:hypothetical protein
MDPEVKSSMRGMDVTDGSLDQDRAAAEQALETAQRNPILSAEQACAVAQVHALLAIERRLAQLSATLVTSSDPGDLRTRDVAAAVFS